MNKQGDWRILPWHEEKLSGAELIYHPWCKTAKNDHDHCAFCWEKFAENEGCLHEGYSTKDGYYWICNPCFQDFKERFRWNAIDEMKERSCLP